LGKFGVTPEKEKALLDKMERLGIADKEIEEHFIRSSKKGGQKKDKTSSCVYLKHLPSGLEVKCQRERSQSLNRFLALRLIVDKIEEKVLGKESKISQRINKIRKQKKESLKRAKQKIDLKEKKEAASN